MEANSILPYITRISKSMKIENILKKSLTNGGFCGVKWWEVVNYGEKGIIEASS